VQVVQIHFRDGQDFLGCYANRNGRHELFLAEALDCAVGEEIALDTYFDHSGYGFRIQARVISRRLSEAGNLRAGARVAVLPSSEPLVTMIVAHARGDEIQYQPRTGQRVECTLPVKVRLPAGVAKGEVVDLALGGMRVVGVSPPPLGTQIAATLYPPQLLLGLPVRGRVAWFRTHPDMAFGVQFLTLSQRQLRRLQKVLEKLRPAP